jgi:4-alpha-glucanotransferase
MTSPTHAQFGAEPARFTPYSPSTRFFLNPLFADVPLERVTAEENGSGADDLIDWARAGPAKAKALRSAFNRFRQKGATAEFESFCRQGGERLAAHALFEALDAHFRSKGIRGFTNWPRGFESPRAQGIRAFAGAAHQELEHQLFLQWLTERSASRAQQAARRTMPIGIIADIAVGMDPEGSHAWSAPHELLRGLHVGAPPDAFNARGQNWGLTSLSPRALELSGFASFIATLRAGMRHAGGVRIDHVMGLRRLWVIPAGASSIDGVYLHHPEGKLLDLLALESLRHRAVVIGEDLGTVPDGFRDAIAAAGILGMQVLWFERDPSGQFLPPAKWRRDAIATTTTHDLPTVAGWWTEYDLDLHKKAGQMRGSEQELRRERASDRANLWSASRRAHCASGKPPARENPDPALAAAIGYVARTRSAIAFVPIEDLAGCLDQPNLPGTTDEHPNWRRRIKDKNVLRKKVVRARIKVFLDARRPR